MSDDFDPSLPYNGMAGHSGSEASFDRDIANLAEGITAAQQREVLADLYRAGERGLTYFEVDTLHVHDVHWVGHSSSSQALSNLHKAGRIAYLTERRGKRPDDSRGSGIYVLPQFINDRDVLPHRPAKPKPRAATPADVMRAASDVAQWAASQRNTGMLVLAPNWDAIDTLTNHLTTNEGSA